MVKHQDKKRKQDLGIFYTPQEAVNFIFDILNIWKNKEDNEIHRWQSRKPKAHFPSVIDPACGEGVFLKVAVTSGFTGYHPTEKTPYVFGVDLDGEVVKRWEDISILHDLFKGNEKKMLNHFHKQNGLVELPDKIFNYKTGGLKEFDAVVGNPPYGGLGIYEEMRQLLQTVYQTQKVTSVKNQVFDTLFGEQEVKQFKVTKIIENKINISNDRLEELKKLSKSLLQYDIWKDEKLHVHRTDYSVKINGLDFNLKSLLDIKEIDRLKSFPIEILFLERFIQLSKPGGWIAIVIPDGILTNSNSDYVREFLSRKTKIEAIVSLPRNTFKNAGTNAKTSILFLRKLRPNEKLGQDYLVFLSSLESINGYNFQKITDAYQKFYNKKEKNMDKSQLVQITKDQSDREAVMVRVDKTLRELMEVKPASRWDPEYWRSVYSEVLDELNKTKYPLEKLGKYVTEMTTNNHVRKMFISEGVTYYQTETIQNTGLLHYLAKKVKENGENDPQRTRLRVGDIMIIRSGTGSVGRVYTVTKDLGKANTVESVYLTRVASINPFYIAVFLLTRFGQAELLRATSGVSGIININRPELEEILIPVLKVEQQNNIEKEYLNMSAYHDKAMEVKKSGNNEEYRTNLEIAEKMLKDLIARTEAVIRGEREDIV